MNLILSIASVTISIFTIYVRFCFNEKRNFMVKILIVGLVLGGVSAMIDSSSFADRQAYSYMFLYRFPNEQLNIYSLFSSSIEPGFIALNQAIYRISQNTRIFYFITTFVMVEIDLFVVYKLNLYKMKTMTVYLLSLHVIFGMFLIRQGIATSLVNLAFLFMIRDKKIISLSLLLSSVLFHSTAVVNVPIYLILMFSRRKPLHSPKFLVLMGVSIVVFFNSILNKFFDLGILSQFLGNYQNHALNSSRFTFVKALPFHFFTGMALFQARKLKQFVPQFHIFITLSVVNSLFWILSFQFYWFWRLSMFTTIPSIILAYYVLNSISNTKTRGLVEWLMIMGFTVITLREALIIFY